MKFFGKKEKILETATLVGQHETKRKIWGEGNSFPYVGVLNAPPKKCKGKKKNFFFLVQKCRVEVEKEKILPEKRKPTFPTVILIHGPASVKKQKPKNALIVPLSFKS